MKQKWTELMRNKQFSYSNWRLQYPTFNMDRTTRQKINREIKDLKNIVN